MRESLKPLVNDVLRVARFPLKNHAETNDGRILPRLRQPRRRRRNLKCPRHSHDADMRPGALQFVPRRVQHCIHIFRVVARSDDGEPSAAGRRFGFSIFAQHNGCPNNTRYSVEARDKTARLNTVQLQSQF